MSIGRTTPHLHKISYNFHFTHSNSPGQKKVMVVEDRQFRPDDAVFKVTMNGPPSNAVAVRAAGAGPGSRHNPLWYDSLRAAPATRKTDENCCSSLGARIGFRAVFLPPTASLPARRVSRPAAQRRRWAFERGGSPFDRLRAGSDPPREMAKWRCSATLRLGKRRMLSWP